MIFSFFVRRKIIKENPDFFRQYTSKKGRVIDQEEDNENNSNHKLK
ncbi:uncharacterized protein OOM_0460 [Francisella orientalis str. Toba 04]|nr:uncharacterized protein OOM_0460 [Francisella orientalis str. Toba 04]